MYLHCMKNVEWASGSPIHKLLEIGVFGSYEITSSSNSVCHCDNDSFSFLLS